MNDVYAEGYEQAINDMDAVVTMSIRKHDGARNAVGILNVFNDVVTFLHESKLDIATAKESPQHPKQGLHIIVDNTNQ